MRYEQCEVCGGRTNEDQDICDNCNEIQRLTKQAEEAGRKLGIAVEGLDRIRKTGFVTYEDDEPHRIAAVTLAKIKEKQ